jgi:hypothetical protein
VQQDLVFIYLCSKTVKQCNGNFEQALQHLLAQQEEKQSDTSKPTSPIPAPTAFPQTQTSAPTAVTPATTTVPITPVVPIPQTPPTVTATPAPQQSTVMVDWLVSFDDDIKSQQPPPQQQQQSTEEKETLAKLAEVFPSKLSLSSISNSSLIVHVHCSDQ